MQANIHTVEPLYINEALSCKASAIEQTVLVAIQDAKKSRVCSQARLSWSNQNNVQFT